MDIDILKKTSGINISGMQDRLIKYIVVHYTAGTSSAAGAALNIVNYFRSGNAAGSADFIVDDGTIVQYNADIDNRYSWAVGGSKYGSMSTSEGGKFYGKCTNMNSISVEICSNKTNKGSLSASDTDWYFTESSIANAVKIVKYLMEKYGIPLDNVIMHHHVTGKICPNPWCVSESRLKLWESFKERLKKTEEEEVVTQTAIKINGKEYTVNRILKDGKNYICLADLAGKGFAVGYEAASKTPSLDNAVEYIPVKIDGMERTLPAVNVEGYNYVHLRSIVNALGGMAIGYGDMPEIQKFCQ